MIPFMTMVRSGSYAALHHIRQAPAGTEPPFRRSFYRTTARRFIMRRKHFSLISLFALIAVAAWEFTKRIGAQFDDAQPVPAVAKVKS